MAILAFQKPDKVIIGRQGGSYLRYDQERIVFYLENDRLRQWCVYRLKK